MIRASGRFARHLGCLLLPAVVAVVAHRYIGIERDDCTGAADLVAGATGRQETFREVFAAFQATEGVLPGGGGRFAIIRSYDAKKLYHHPELFFVRGAAPDRTVVEWVGDGAERAPVHRVIYENATPARAVAYMLISESQPIANPYYAQLAAMPRALLSGAPATTLAFVSMEGSSLEGKPSGWLLDFWRRYKAACRAPS